MLSANGQGYGPNTPGWVVHVVHTEGGAAAAEVQQALLLAAHMLDLNALIHKQNIYIVQTLEDCLSLQRVLLLNMDRSSHGHSRLHTCNGTVFSFSHHARLFRPFLQHQCEGNHLCYDE